MATLTNATLRAMEGYSFSWLPVFSPADAFAGPEVLFFDIPGLAPTGLSLNPDTGQVYGTPTSLGTYSLTLQVLQNGMTGPEVVDSFPISIQVVEGFFWSRNPITTRYNFGAPYIKARLRLSTESRHLQGDFTELVVLDQTADADGFATYEYSSVLNALLLAQAERDTPTAPSTDTHHRCRSILRRVLVEFSIELVSGGWLGWASLYTRTVVLGEIAYPDWPARAGLSALAQGPLVLNSARFAHRLTPGAVAFVYLIKTGTGTISARSYFTHKETGAVREVVYSATGTGSVSGLFGIRVQGWPMEGESARFRVRLFVAGNPVGPELAFEADLKERDRGRVLLFRNSKGCLQTLACTGLATEKMEVERSGAERTDLPTYPPNRPLYQIHRVKATRTVQVSTGWLPSAGLASETAQELLASYAVFELIEGTLYPVLLAKKSLTLREDQADLVALGLEYEYAFPLNAAGSL